MADAPTTTTGKIEVTAKIERATGEIEHVRLVNGRWVPIENSELKERMNG